jgi:tRNA pseudouridine55 synthase
VHTGFLNIDKPAGMTSHDVVDVVRRAAGQRQVGHTGTLDPFATGVLVLVLGRATRLANLLAGADKTYRGEITLGRATTTYDTEGETTSTGSVDHLDEEGIRAALALFRGSIDQVPPPYSAKKVGGKKLYELARAGETVVVEPKQVTIHHLEMLGWNPPSVEFEAVVSAGTYARSLAFDLGQALGCGGHLSRLERTAVGRLTIAESISLDVIREQPDSVREHLISVSEALPEIPSVTVNPEAQARLLNGTAITLPSRGVGTKAAGAKRLFAVTEQGAPVALVESLPTGPGSLLLQPKVQLQSD